jgi:hypothetical protein
MHTETIAFLRSAAAPRRSAARRSRAFSFLLTDQNMLN